MRPSLNRLPSLISAAVLAALPLASAHAAIDRVVEKSFAVQPGGKLQVGTQGGRITVDSSAGATVVKVTAKEHIRADSEAEADEILKQLTLTIEQEGNDVSARSEYAHSTGFHFGSWPPVQVDFVVTVPTRYSAELNTSGGGITVGDLDGTLQAHTSGGGIRMGRITQAIAANTSGGNIALEQGGASVRLATSGGSIKLGPVAGTGDVRTSGGDIQIEGMGGPLSARTSGGDIRVTFAGALKGDCRLTTSGGRVTAKVGANVAYHLDASTSGGRVRAEGLTITVDQGGAGKSRLSGDVNRGGPVLSLRTSGGDIVVEPETLAANGR